MAKGIGTFTQKKALYPLIIVIALLSTPGLHSYYADVQKTDWRDTAAFIEHNADPDDVIIICPEMPQEPFDYYYEGDLGRFGIDPGAEPSEITAALDNATAGKKRLWFVLDIASRMGGALLAYLEQTCNGPVLEEEFTGVGIFLFDL